MDLHNHRNITLIVCSQNLVDKIDIISYFLYIRILLPCLLFYRYLFIYNICSQFTYRILTLDFTNFISYKITYRSCLLISTPFFIGFLKFWLIVLQVTLLLFIFFVTSVLIQTVMVYWMFFTLNFLPYSNFTLLRFSSLLSLVRFLCKLLHYRLFRCLFTFHIRMSKFFVFIEVCLIYVSLVWIHIVSFWRLLFSFSFLDLSFFFFTV